MKIALKGGLVILGLLVTLLLFFAIWLWTAVHLPTVLPPSQAPSRGDTVLSGFYAPPERMPAEPGVMIRQEDLSGNSILESAGANIRLLYSSTDGLGAEAITPVSGALYLPEGEPPEGGWPLMIWSHGTVGIGDVCAPSYAGRGERDPIYLNPWLEQGFAIAASDYQGLGTPGTHPYMDARTMAYNNLDLARALQASDVPLSARLVIAGQSQGATGAIASASYANSYAPDVDLAGIIATGIPHFSAPVIWELVANSDRDEASASLSLSLYMLTFAEMLDPDFKLDPVLTDQARPVVEQIGQTCVFDFVANTQEAELSNSTTFVSRVEVPLMQVFSRANLYNLDFDTPVFAGSGTADKITPFFMQQEFLADACAAGATINAVTYEGANHNQGLLKSTQGAQDFARLVLSDGKVANTCEQ
ncbi:lipase family protein [Erythrobacter sp. Alg231-14]|uniref:lipase family protein n=1 Tax=Erythrobacter sp. Alg231-14 TaxID=1922225 RepID=UPI000D54C93B